MLVVVDMQKSFIEEAGAERMIPRVADKIRRRKREGYEVLLTLDKSGGDLDGEIAEACGRARVFEKRSYGSEELVGYLKEREAQRVEFVGICTDICVITNVLATITVLPYAEIAVDGGCCAAQTLEGHNCALRIMKSCNIEVN